MNEEPIHGTPQRDAVRLYKTSAAAGRPSWAGGSSLDRRRVTRPGSRCGRDRRRLPADDVARARVGLDVAGRRGCRQPTHPRSSQAGAERDTPIEDQIGALGDAPGRQSGTGRTRPSDRCAARAPTRSGRLSGSSPSGGAVERLDHVGGVGQVETEPEAPRPLDEGLRRRRLSSQRRAEQQVDGLARYQARRTTHALQRRRDLRREKSSHARCDRRSKSLLAILPNRCGPRLGIG